MPELNPWKFQNALADLKDCQDTMYILEGLSEDERTAMKELIQLCGAIFEDYGEDY